MAQLLQPQIKYKTFSYHTQVTWENNRSGTIYSDGKPEIRVSSPPEFKGEAGVWSPEDLFVASVNICTMTTFMAFAQRSKLPIASYNSFAKGVLKFIDGKYRFTKIILLPTILVENFSVIEQAEKILQDAHEKCLIANSIHAEVVIEPKFGILSKN